ncbi:hypothetical protein DIU31_014355 [Mucilaginibacter rubeus]|uniref:Uncharacterized protein n=1 Tax=Mucilaginibacter rubeus TaxID=2027860 RepID=A0AAE6JH17_9SPHI|nr:MULTISPECIES: hypothetical protein [Mucilaginibacter]QEM04637.1 hypothetical protein DIU31_014355 [Mucilaginibacter rubeus]QEM17230.1 hypothetical protein DIU38_014500 [Mucilaginibacter gossypii]QTE46264.1 hypothetical protein J3L19_13205 [Mucilaginibacter rubeus]QTE52861.1 hypothetical protein J3L21_13180 [Mucilaginibacter rubeus]QTE57947.1 hypothetical protein J3L23_04850 [Mucilaginibacter rubeus]
MLETVNFVNKFSFQQLIEIKINSLKGNKKGKAIYRSIKTKTMILKQEQQRIMTKRETIKLIGANLCNQLFEINGHFQYGRDERTFTTRCKDEDLKQQVNKVLEDLANGKRILM